MPGKKFDYGTGSGKVSKSNGQSMNWADVMIEIRDLIQLSREEGAQNYSAYFAELTKIGAATIGAAGIKVDDVLNHVAPGGYTIFAIKAVTETVVAAVVGDIDMNGETIPISDVIYGNWHSVRLTSGTAILYYKEV